jgi:transcriptional regulator with XRE-family HTH domain
VIKLARLKFNSIKEARLKRNKTQLDIAKAVNISESYYNLIENGKRTPPVDLAAVISRELNITLDNFFLLYNLTKCEEKQLVI